MDISGDKKRNLPRENLEWLRKENLQRETLSLQIIAQNKEYVKARVDKVHQK